MQVLLRELLGDDTMFVEALFCQLFHLSPFLCVALEGCLERLPGPGALVEVVHHQSPWETIAAPTVMQKVLRHTVEGVWKVY